MYMGVISFVKRLYFAAFSLVVVKLIGLRKVGMVSSILSGASLIATSQITSVPMFILFCGALAGKNLGFHGMRII